MPDGGLPVHVEEYLGEIEAGWSQDAMGARMPFQVVRCRLPSLEGCIAFCTLGLSRYQVRSRSTGRQLRHEFVMILPERLRDGPVPGLLQQLGQEALMSGDAVLRGDVIGPRGSIFSMTEMDALYASVPVYLPDPFHQYDSVELGGVAFVWLVPISSAEARFVRNRGWEAFEELLTQENPDLVDVDRRSIVQHDDA